jgi:fatty-acyl-CoA synthase
MAEMLTGLMQDDFPLNLHHVRRRMRDCHPDAEVVTLTEQGTVRASFAEISARVDRLARALGRLGIEPGDRVGTFAWNNQRHFELYMAVPCIGAVLHTLNVRLFAEQLTYIVNHAADRVIFLDDSLVPIMEQLAPQMPAVEHFVVMGDGDGGSLPGVLRYEELLDDADLGSDQPFDYPEIDERRAAALCYTSGTTGNPKGVLYSHRSISLHSTATLLTDALGLSRHDRALVVVPMFHANAWGIPHGAALAGADLVMPDRFLQAEPLARLIESERPTVMGCVPTIFADLLRYADAHPECDLSSLTNAACGGSAVPRQLMKDFQERHAVRIFQAWGMTETSPVATYSRPDEPAAQGAAGDRGGEGASVGTGEDTSSREGPEDVLSRAEGVRAEGVLSRAEGVLSSEDPAARVRAGAREAAPEDAYWDDRARQGKPLPWVELRLVGDDGREVPWDGESTGEIQVRGPWIAARYYNDTSGDPKFEDGWLRTGDIASANSRASIQITDRTKDVIKSGGEWISSVELENELMAHPDVLEAAVIAKPDARWAERPLCCVVLRPGADVGADELIEHLRPRVAKWWLPDEFAFIAEVPKTSVGKFDKKVLRARLHDGELHGRVLVGAAAAPSAASASSESAAEV